LLRSSVRLDLESGRVFEKYESPDFQADNGNAVTVNAERCRDMVTEFSWPDLHNIDTEGMWFRQDGATCHTARATITLMREKFQSRLLSRSGDQNLGRTSFVWGYVNVHVYGNKPRTIEQPEEEIRRELDTDTCRGE